MPTAVAQFRVPLDFQAWVTRMRTPEVQVEAIRALQAVMARPVTHHFAIQNDGSYTIDVALMQATWR